MRKILLIDGHPDPAPERLNHALAGAYAEAARQADNEVRCVTVATLEFPLLRTQADFEQGTPPAAIAQAQRDVRWADHYVFIYPLWLGEMPALLKAFLEQTFRPGIALGQSARGLPKPLLRGKSARIIVTMGMPAFFYRSYMRSHSTRGLERMLALTGVRPLRETVIGSVFSPGKRAIRRWFSAMRCAVHADCAKPRSIARRALGIPPSIALAVAAAYGAYAVWQWARYGSVADVAGDDLLLDRIMPDYEVCVRHGATVDANADEAFEAIAALDFRHLPTFANALFRTRELMMRSRSSERSMPDGLLDQLASLGWTVMPQSSAREIVLITATQPWQATPVFTAVPAAEFTPFDEPGYAKIALSVRTLPRGDGACEVLTETRVQTTDPQSRAHFRRYWALVSPGVALIRIAMLKTVKRAAESRSNGLPAAANVLHSTHSNAPDSTGGDGGNARSMFSAALACD